MTDSCATCVFNVSLQCRHHSPADPGQGSTGALGKTITSGYWCGDGVSTADGHLFSTKLNQGPQGPTGAQGATGPVGPTGPTGATGPTGPAYSFGPGTATASAGAATLNTNAGTITSEALVAATSYTLTLADNKILSGSLVMVNVLDSAAGLVSLLSVAVTAGQVVISVSMAALTGTLKFNFAVFN